MIGPAVNLVSRVEAVAKSLDLPLVVSDDFVAAYGESLPSIGMHKLRGSSDRTNFSRHRGEMES